MKWYVVAEITLTDPSWVNEYIAAVTPMTRACYHYGHRCDATRWSVR